MLFPFVHLGELCSFGELVVVFIWRIAVHLGELFVWGKWWLEKRDLIPSCLFGGSLFIWGRIVVIEKGLHPLVYLGDCCSFRGAVCLGEPVVK